MKKQLFHFILAGCLLIITNFTFAQKNSYPTKKINGTEYYIYSVEASEGLYAISRKFDVDKEEIIKANPEVKDGLRFGQVLLIPIQKGSKQIEKESSQEFIEHKVEKRQTLFAISRKYGVSQDEIKKMNPEISNGLREGMTLKIPVANNNKKEGKTVKAAEKVTEKDQSKQKEEKTATKTHIVQPKETLYSISKKYDVEIEDIVAANPGVDKKLSIGMELKIPAVHKQTKVNQPEEKTVKSSETTSNYLESATKKEVQTINPKDGKTLRIAYLLPFMLDNTKTDNGSDRFMNFYAGSLIAMNEAKEKGISLQIYTYDTGKTEDRLKEILSNNDLKSMDIIIGPAYSNQVGIMGDFAKENKIKTLIPFSSKVSEIDYNPYLFQFNPGTESEIKFATELINGRYKRMNIVFADIQDISYFDDGKVFSQTLRRNLSDIKKEYSVLNLTTSENADFTSSLKKDTKNLIIFNTDKFTYVNPCMALLKNMSSQYDITLYAQYSWKDQPDKLAKSIFISPFTSSIDQSQLSTFNQKFSETFNWNATTDAPRYDLLGYDITSYFIALLSKYGNKLPEKLSLRTNSSWIQSQPAFERRSEHSGFINQQLYLTEDKKN